jgi:hypothetical protein
VIDDDYLAPKVVMIEQKERGTVLRYFLMSALLSAGIAACGSEDASRGTVVPDATLGPDAGDFSDVSLDVSNPDGGEPTDVAEDIVPDVVEDIVPDIEEDVPPDVEEVRIPTTIDTVLTQTLIEAGTTVTVRCEVQDQFGEVMGFEDPQPRSNFLVSPDGSIANLSPTGFRGVRVGEVEVTCTMSTFNLLDETPAVLTITPGPIARTIATVEETTVDAGTEVDVFCEGFDEFGNETTGKITIGTDPFGSGVLISDSTVTITEAGIFDIFCTAEGVTEQTSDVLEVVPGLPATLSVAVSPNRSVYGLGEVATLRTLVADQYGNLIRDAVVIYEADPNVPAFGNGRFRFDEEGIIVLGATVPLPTFTGEPLFDSVQVIVNGDGPTIDCTSPFDGEMLVLNPGETVAFEASASDTFAVENVLINGEPGALTADGTYVADVTTRRGINFVNVSAQDAFGEENSTLCAFMVSDTYVAPGAQLANSISLRLAQEAFDDNNRTDPIDSLSDIIYGVLNNEVSPGRLALENLIDGAIAPGSNIVDQCFFTVPIFGGCGAGARVRYLRNNVESPNATSLTLIDGGLRLTATIRRIDLTIRIEGRGALGFVDTTGPITVENVNVATTLNLRTGPDGRPDISVRAGTTSLTIGRIATNFNGLDGDIINLVVGVANGLFRDAITGVIRGLVETTLSGALDGLLGSLGVDALSTAIDLPRLDGSGNISLGFGLGFNTTNANPQRALFGLGTRITGPPLRPPGEGSLQNPGPMLLDQGGRAVGAGVHLGLLNQIFYGLWRGEFFDANLGGFIGGAGLGEADATLTVDLPPTVVGRDGGGVNIHFGAARLSLTIPGLIEEPLALKIGAVASADVVIVDETNIEFRDLELSEFYFSTIDASLPADTRAVLENFLRNLVQSLLDDALNSALPTLPIPSFALPAALADFGLPAGASLGLLAPILQLTDTHFVVQGNFGIQ